MRKFRTDILIFLALLLFTYVVLTLMIGRHAAADVQIYDSYFVVAWPSLFPIVFGPIAFFIFLGRALTLRFRGQSSNIGLAVGMILFGQLMLRYALYQHSFLDLFQESEFVPGEVYLRAQRNFYLTIGTLVIWSIGFCVLIVRTIRIWKPIEGQVPSS